MPHDTSLQPDPETGWSRECVTVRPALVVPPDVSKMVQPCGVFGPEGYIGHSATWRGGKPMMVPPEARPEPAAQLAGRHLWVGQLWSHFGHFMCESLARIWGLAQAGEIDGLVFTPKRPKSGETVRGYQKEFLTLLGIDLPVRVLTQPTEVEELVVPGQGFGLGRIDRGTPEFRAFFRDRFAAGIAPEGGDKLYLSRSALGGLEGGALLETVLEQNLAKAGYEIYHPEKHSIREQVARYRAATHVIGLDGSAFHLFGFVAREDQKAAVILRRTSNVYRGLSHQIASFSGRPPDIVKAVAADWVNQQRGKPSRNSFGQLDFSAIGTRLTELGYIEGTEGWTLPTPRAFKLEMKRIAQAKGALYTRQGVGRAKSVGPRPQGEAA